MKRFLKLDWFTYLLILVYLWIGFQWYEGWRKDELIRQNDERIKALERQLLERRK